VTVLVEEQEWIQERRMLGQMGQLHSEGVECNEKETTERFLTRMGDLGATWRGQV